MMQAGKTPSPDWFPVQFYKTYVEKFAPKFQESLSQVSDSGVIPDSSDAVIV